MSIFADNCWKSSLWLERTKWHQRFLRFHFYHDKIFEALIFGICIGGFFIGWERKGDFSND